MSDYDPVTGSSFDGGGGNRATGHLTRAAGKRTRTMNLPPVDHGTSTASRGGSAAGTGTTHTAHDDPYDFRFGGGIVMFGVTLTADAGAAEFSFLEDHLGSARVTMFRQAAGRGADDVLALFEANGVIIDQHERAVARSVAEAYIRWLATDPSAALAGRRDDHMTAGKHATAAGGGSLTFDALRDLVTGWGGEIELDRYFEVGLEVAIPTEVPGLEIDLGGKLKFVRSADGDVDLTVAMSIGASWTIFKLLSVGIEETFQATLTGDDLGAAFVDCVKQTFRTVAKTAGVEAQLVDLRRMAKEGPTTEEYFRAAFGALVPVFGGVEAAKVAIATLGGDYVVEAVDAYFEFFKDDPDSGFKVSIGVEGNVKAGDKLGISAGGAIGIEEGVGDSEATWFGEVFARGSLKVDPCALELSYTGRADKHGWHNTVGFELELPWSGANLADAAVALATSPEFGRTLTALTRGESPDSTAMLGLLGQGVMAAANDLLLIALDADQKIAIGVEVTCGSHGWEEVKGTVRTINEVEMDLELVKAHVSTGTVLDVSAPFRAALPELTE